MRNMSSFRQVRPARRLLRLLASLHPEPGGGGPALLRRQPAPLRGAVLCQRRVEDRRGGLLHLLGRLQVRKDEMH